MHNRGAMEINEIEYTDAEIRSYLPSGWNVAAGGDPAALPGDDEARWDAKSRTWKIKVFDDVDFDWEVAVHAREVEKLGRLEALRQAIDRTQRQRLGKPTRGLGLARL